MDVNPKRGEKDKTRDAGERRGGGRVSQGRAQTRELFSRVRLGIESKSVASLSVQEKWSLGREGMGGYL